MKLALIFLLSLLMSSVSACGGKRAADRGYRAPHRAQYVQYGIASWYGGRNQGRIMACGKRFNQNAMVAADRTLPLGTRVKVTNLRNGRSVVVRIMDRGPYIAGRVIDLSKAAANRLRFTHRGLTPVRIRVLSTPAEQKKEAELARDSRRAYRGSPVGDSSGPSESSSRASD